MTVRIPSNSGSADRHSADSIHRHEAGRFGNAGRNIVRGPGLANFDVSVFKSFRWTEARQLQFRVECFNVANHANFGIPVTDLASANFGRILDAGSPRLLQFGLKFLF